jgi:hypothetical protein
MMKKLIVLNSAVMTVKEGEVQGDGRDVGQNGRETA